MLSGAVPPLRTLNLNTKRGAVLRPLELIVMPIVTNKYRTTPSANAVYIGRGSPYGNPFIIGVDGDRNSVCDKFEKLILSDTALLEKVKQNLKNHDLVCFCAPDDAMVIRYYE